MTSGRRAFLAALAAGTTTLSGCSTLFGLFGEDRPSGPDSAPRTTGTTPTDTATIRGDAPGRGEWPDPPRDERDRTYSLTTLEPAGRTLSLSDTTVTIGEPAGGPFRDREPAGRVGVAAAFARPETDDHPALLRTALRADWRARLDPRTRTLDLTRIPFFDDYGFGPYVLAPTANHDLVDAEDVPAAERGPNGGWRLRWGPDSWLPEHVDVARHERVHGEYRVLRSILGEAPVDPRRITIEPPDRADDRNDSPITLSVWGTDTPGPNGSSQFRGRSVPSLPGASETVWYHDLDPATPVFLRPEVERSRLPVRLRFELVNHSRGELRPTDDLTVHKRHDGVWYRIRHSTRDWYRSVQFGGATLPGEVRPFERAVFVGEGLETGVPRLRYLGGGTYAFSVGVGPDVSARPHQLASSGGDSPARLAALVELTGESVTVEPQAGISTSRDGATVTVETRTVGSETVTAVVERIEEPGDVAPTVLAEQVMHGENDVLRNALPFFEPGVERVRVVTTPGVVATALGERGKPPVRFRYRDEAFRLSLVR